MNVSLIITSRNRLRLFKKSWASIRPQLTTGDELVVVEDSDNPSEWKNFLNDIPFKSTFVCTYNNAYRGCSVAKNIAVKLATNPILVINDPEVFHLSPCIIQLKEQLVKNPLQFAVPGTLYSGQHSGQPWNEASLTEHSQAPFVGMVLKEEIEKIGGWDERFKYWANDDNDLMYRLGLNGCKHKVYDDLTIFHQWHERPPKEAMGDYNESLLYEAEKSIVANKDKEWGVIEPHYELWQKTNT